MSHERDTIVVLGESTSSDVYDPKVESWPIQLKKRLHAEEKKIAFSNLSYPSTVTPILYQELVDNFSDVPPKIVVTMMGVNDSPYFWPRTSGLVNESIWRNIKTFQVINILYSLMMGKEVLLRLPKRLNSPIKNLEPALNYDPKIFAEPNWSYSDNWSPTAKAKFYYKYAHRLMPEPSEKNKDTVRSAYIYFGKALEYSIEVEQLGEIFTHLSRMYYPEGCNWLAEKFIKQNGHPSPGILTWLSECLKPESKIGREFLNRFSSNYKIDTQSKTIPTRTVYESLSSWAQKNDVCVIALTYANNDSFNLRELIQNLASEHFILVDQQPSFEKALAYKKYEEIFSDAFAQSFGHATEEGNRIIAVNVYETLLGLAIKDRCGVKMWFQK